MNNLNPYAAPKPAGGVASVADTAAASTYSFLLPLTLAIGLSGAVFGLIGGPIGMFVGGIIAFPVAAIVTFLMLSVASVVTGNRVTVFSGMSIGAVSGFVSGFLSVMVLAGGQVSHIFGFGVLAGFVGCIGGVLGAAGRSAFGRRVPYHQITAKYSGLHDLIGVGKAD